MAKRITLKDVKKVEVEPRLYLSEFQENPRWTIADFGVYVILDLLLYTKGNKLEYNGDLAAICRMSADEFTKAWKKVETKFQKRGNQIAHKKVGVELSRSRKRLQDYVNKGLATKKNRQLNTPSNGSLSPEEEEEEDIKRKKIKKKKYIKRFRPPSLEEVEAYCSEKDLTIKPEYVWGFYEKKGWKVGRFTMTNWHIAVSQAENWENAPRRKKQPPTPEQEVAALEKKRQEIRDCDGRYFHERTTKELEAILAAPKDQRKITRGWLIREIIAERNKR